MLALDKANLIERLRLLEFVKAALASSATFPPEYLKKLATLMNTIGVELCIGLQQLGEDNSPARTKVLQDIETIVQSCVELLAGDIGHDVVSDVLECFSTYLNLVCCSGCSSLPSESLIISSR